MLGLVGSSWSMSAMRRKRPKCCNAANAAMCHKQTCSAHRPFTSEHLRGAAPLSQNHLSTVWDRRLRRPAHEARIEFLHRMHAALLHGCAGFRPQKIEHALDAILAERAETPQIRSPDADPLRTHGE